MRQITRIVSLVVAATLGLKLASTEAIGADPKAKVTALAAFEVPADERQLFLDDQGIAEIHKLIRTLHQPEKRGAVIRPDQPWESALQVRCAPAWDEGEQVFKLWMITSTPLPEFGGTTYAHSKDGINWTKPILRQREYQGSLDNNFLAFETNLMENVVYDSDEADPSRRFKAFLGAIGRLPAVSPDGIHWQKLDAPMLPSRDESNLSYDHQARTFIATLKQGGPYGRAHTLSTSKDFETWTTPELVFHADELDQELGVARIRARLADPTLQQPVSNNADYYKVDVYNLAAFRYESIYVGLAAMFHSTGPSTDGRNTDGFHLVELACSRDLRNWTRLGRRQPFIGPSQLGKGAYDLTQILPPSGPVVRGDELWFYYTGLKYRETPKDPDPDAGAICLAVLRRDGFVSLDADEEAGSLITEPFRIPGRRLFVNVAAPEGELRATVLNASGQPIAGFGIGDCVPVTGDQARAEITWRGQPDLWPLTAQEVQIRFQLRKGSLYSYWFEEVPAPQSSGSNRKSSISTDHSSAFFRSDAPTAFLATYRGAASAVMNGSLGRTVFEATPLFRKLWPKLLKSYAFDAAIANDSAKAGKACSVADAKAFLDKAMKADVEKSHTDKGLVLTTRSTEDVTSFSADADAAMSDLGGAMGGGGMGGAVHSSAFAR